VPKFGRPGADHLVIVAGPGGFFDAALGFVLLPGDALGVDAQQHVHAVASPLGDLGRRHSGVQPSGDRRMTEIIGAPRSNDADSVALKALVRALWKIRR
jgi:hypothetical protein